MRKITQGWKEKGKIYTSQKDDNYINQVLFAPIQNYYIYSIERGDNNNYCFWCGVELTKENRFTSKHFNNNCKKCVGL